MFFSYLNIFMFIHLEIVHIICRLVCFRNLNATTILSFLLCPAPRVACVGYNLLSGVGCTGVCEACPCCGCVACVVSSLEAALE